MRDLLKRGIDLENNTLRLTGEVNEGMYELACEGLALLKADNLVVQLNSGGGEVNQGFAIYNLLDIQDNVKIVCMGVVASISTIILQAGTERVAYPHTEFLLHYGEDAATSSTQEVKHNKKVLKDMETIYLDRVNVKRRTVSNWFTKDVYYTAEEALKVGLIDRIAT